MTPERVLLIGVGNDLRGDDGAGPAVARALARRLPWRVEVVHGLTPELVSEIAEVERVYFVDASADVTLMAPRWCVHMPGVRERGPLFGHALDAVGLLAWCAALHGRVPLAATLALPARNFELGAPFSEVTAAAVAQAVAEFERLAGIP